MMGLTELVPCIGNGNGAPGAVIKMFGKEARQLLWDADMVISKSHGNFEGLFGEGLNPYYFFLSLIISGHIKNFCKKNIKNT